MLWFLTSLSSADNPCHELLHRTGKRYKNDNRCSRHPGYDPVDDVYTCMVTTYSSQHVCNLSVSDIQCPYRAIWAIAINDKYEDVIITTVEEK